MMPNTLGFGLPPSWRLPLLVGSTMVLVGLLIWLVGDQGSLILGAGGGAILLLGLVRWRRYRADAQLRRQQPVSPAERTARLLAAVGASATDLAANAAGTITPAQWRRIAVQTGSLGTISGPLPAVQCVEGPAILSGYHMESWIWYDLTINGVRFRSTTDTVVNAVQRSTPYRVYFAEIPTPDRLQQTTRVLLSAQAIGTATPDRVA